MIPMQLPKPVLGSCTMYQESTLTGTTMPSFQNGPPFLHYLNKLVDISAWLHPIPGNHYGDRYLGNCTCNLYKLSIREKTRHARFHLGPRNPPGITTHLKSTKISSPRGSGCFGRWTQWHFTPLRVLSSQDSIS